MRKLLPVFLVALVLILSPARALADYFVPQGAGQPVAQLVLNKQVQNPQTGLFVENLTVTDAHFLPGQEVNFRIEVRNTGGNELKEINVKDVLPDFVDFVSGSGNFVVDKLGAGESKSFDMKIKIRAQVDLPKNQLTCLTNLAQASVNQIFTQDTSVFCIETQVLGIAGELPKTGPGNVLPVLLASSFSLIMSIFLFKKSRQQD